jgi:hypothetical protein
VVDHRVRISCTAVDCTANSGRSAHVNRQVTLAKISKSKRGTRRAVGGKSGRATPKRSARTRTRKLIKSSKEKSLLVRIKIENAGEDQERELRLLIDQAIQERFNEVEIEYDD